MKNIVGVRFKRLGKIYFFDPQDIKLEKRDQVIVETAQGDEFGEVLIANRYIENEKVKEPLKKVIRKATEKDKKHYEECKKKEKEAKSAENPYKIPKWMMVTICVILGLAVLLLDFRRVKARHETLRLILCQLPTLPETLPAAHTVPEEDYRALVQALCAQQQALETRMNAQYQDMLDYYTLWAHQIKTPIASMRLCLQQEDTPQARRLLQELSRAEQYVEMVMVYLRLTGGSDLVLREYELDAIVRRAVRRFAGEFIGRKLKLCYEPLNVSCVTDEKWLLFVIEQVLSNALKYTRAGSITIELEAPKTLVIRDTGIGVAPEDLPRIFEKGYTGYNGRGDQKASGLGLYLCRTICKRLGHTITASSVPDHGTAIRITLEQRQVRE